MSTVPVWDLVVRDQTAYLACGSEGIAIVDLSNLSSPKLISQLRLPGDARSIQVNANTAFLACSYEGLCVVDIANKTIPELVGRFETPSCAQGIELDGNTVYLANGYVGVSVLDVSNPRQPVAIDTLNFSEYASTLRRYEKTLFVGDVKKTIHLFQVEQPSIVSIWANSSRMMRM